MSRTAGFFHGQLRSVLTVVVLLASAVARADTLADALSPYVGQQIDVVELATGKRFVRPLLQKVMIRNGETQSLRLLEEGQGKPVSLLLRGITKIVAGRETVYEAEVTGRSTAQVRERAARERREQEHAASRARMKARGVEPWPELSAAEHAAEVESLKAYVEQVRGVFPDLQVAETH